jgi:hypothetical protein
MASIGSNNARVWDLTFYNRSSRAFDLKKFVLTANAPNGVRAVKVLATNESGIKVRAEIDDGLLTLVAERFHRTRTLPVSILLDSPDRPIVTSSIGDVLTRYRLKPETITGRTEYLFMHHQRVMFMLLGYFAAMSILIVRLIWLAIQGPIS